MRPLVALAALALLGPAALAGHATYVDESRVVGCLLLVRVGTVQGGLNCPGIARTVPAAEPPGGSYRLTVTWSPTSADWSSLQADIKSCAGSCEPGGSGVCLNNSCLGSPGGGNLVQSASALGGSPLVVSIPTAGNESNVTFVIQLPGPLHASLASQGLHYKLEHVG